MSGSVQTTAYECQWYSSDQIFQRAVQMIILRAQRPVVLTAGKMYNMSLSTFTLIMKNSYSIFALLRQIHNKEQNV
uniref:Uncharacterized protein n=1 Tax=Timema poppense TaxID=170557 RepID=A0A7R9DSB0_TIMPO|nr:unnamed protein product [Timema poppensis]